MYTFTRTYTSTHAKYLASKVVADLYQCALLYDEPAQQWIADYEQELTALLAGRYVATYEFGFKRDGRRVVSWHYTVGPSGDLEGDARSGGLRRGVEITRAKYFNFLTHSDTWSALGAAEREAIEATLPFKRTAGEAPTDGAGQWKTEQAYAAGGVLLQRRSFQPW